MMSPARRSTRTPFVRSKRGNLLKQFDQLCYWVRDELRVREVMLDGEVVALDPEGGRTSVASWLAAATSITPPSTCSGSTGRTCATYP